MNATARVLAVTLLAGGLAQAACGAPPSLWGVGAWMGQGPAPPAGVPGDRRAQSDALLLQARIALAGGDARRAEQFASQAKSLGAAYQLNEDSPERIGALIRKHAQFVVNQSQNADVNPQVFQRQYAQFLLDQAEGLMRYQRLPEAEHLIRQAAGMNAQYGEFERTPQRMLQQIAAAQGQTPPPIGGGPGNVAQVAYAAPVSPSPIPGASPTGDDIEARKGEAIQLLRRAQSALSANDFGAATRLAQQASALRIPDAAFGPDEPKPWEVLRQIGATQSRNPVIPAGGALPPRNGEFQGLVQQGVYNPADDSSRVVPAQAQTPAPALFGQTAPLQDPPSGGLPPVPSRPGDPPAFPQTPPNRFPESSPLRPTYPTLPTTGNPPTGNPPALNPAPTPQPGYVTSEGERHYRLGLDALQKYERDAALQHFREAWKHESELDPATRSQLKDKLSYLQSAGPPAALPDSGQQNLESIASQQQVAFQELQVRVTTETRTARQQVNDDPIGALNRLQRLREEVQQSNFAPSALKNVLTLVDRQIAETEQHIEQNRPSIELEQRNAQVRQAISADRDKLSQVNNQVAKLVDEFNQLIDEQRFSEAEVVAKQAYELAPDLPVVENIKWKSRFARQLAANIDIKERKEAGFLGALESVDESSIPMDDRNPIDYGSPRKWNELTRRRQRYREGEKRRLTDTEQQIYRNLSNKVEVSFNQAPLSEVLMILGKAANVPMHLDEQALRRAIIASDEPVSINISQPIMLKSALNLILDPFQLSYVVKDEVLKITTANAKETDVYTIVYNVADLVIPIPNFVPSYDIGLPAAIREAHAAIGYGALGGSSRQLPFMLAGSPGQGSGAPQGNSFLAQMSGAGLLPHSASRPSQPMGMGPGGMGGAALADFDTLIELITATIAPDTWEEVGGPGAIEPFPTNLSLVVSQRQDVHEEIADLLDQLRRLQDLQITIEVRFITLTDNFFERIGIDFDVDIDDNSLLGNGTPVNLYPDDIGPSVTIGLDPMGNPTADLDLKFGQNSFGATQPQFGGFDASTAANFGFAILSDIEVFFLLEAAQGDNRSNVLQAPKVTLFNGQSASVSDTSQRPFVTSIIPVVGDFAAAHQPVITVLNEGTSLNVQGVISPDRRYVRLTLVPFFSQIGEVDTFTFEGRSSSDTGTQIVDDQGNPTGRANNSLNSRQGSTVQLPTFSFTTVSTTVSVPDGGTVLLGGIKRLREGRNERGVPMLSKLPYVNRLFRNVGIGRDTQSLMLMVTPRIIIQEEEENNIGVNPTEP